MVDFNNLQLSEDVFKDVDVGFCCLGTTKAKSGSVSLQFSPKIMHLL